VADGESVISGASELRVKETDRIAGTASILRAVGARVDEMTDGLSFPGGSSLRGGASLDPLGDHRLAMLAGVAGRASSSPVTIVGADCVDVSWPGFWNIL
jgi:3-phosphoshikimate 1-carboxyvinyltransferase